MTPIDWTNWGDATNVVRVLGFLIPIVTALVTKLNASSQVKSLVTLTLAVLTASVATLVAADGGWDLNAFLNAFMNTFIPAIAAYYGLLKPAGVTGYVAEATAGVGLGSSDGGPYYDDHGETSMTTLGLVLLAIAVVLYIFTTAPAVATLCAVVGIVLVVVGAVRQ